MSKKSPKSVPGKNKQEKRSASSKDEIQGAGGELHQIAGGEHPALTTNQGLALSDNQNSLRANERGPTLLEENLSNNNSASQDQAKQRAPGHSFKE